LKQHNQQLCTLGDLCTFHHFQGLSWSPPNLKVPQSCPSYETCWFVGVVHLGLLLQLSSSLFQESEESHSVSPEINGQPVGKIPSSGQIVCWTREMFNEVSALSICRK
jgi:hypothetical protein